MANKLTKEKAGKILHDKEVRGHPLTEKQRRFFGAKASGQKMRTNPAPPHGKMEGTKMCHAARGKMGVG